MFDYSDTYPNTKHTAACMVARHDFQQMWAPPEEAKNKKKTKINANDSHNTHATPFWTHK